MKTLRKITHQGTVAYCSDGQYIPEKFAFSYGQMVQYNSLHDLKSVYYDHSLTSWLPRGRNDLAKNMRGDWLLMLDTDVEFSPDTVSRLIKVADKYKAPVVTGLCVMKKYPHLPILYSWNDERNVYENILQWPPETEIFQCDASGAGCLFIRKFVFDLIWTKLKDDPFATIGTLSEDMSFFDRLRKLGVGVYCAPQVYLSHLYVVGQDYDPDQFGNLHKKFYIR